MYSDKFSNVIYEEQDLVDLLYRDQTDFLSKIYCDNDTNIDKLAEISNLKLQHFDSKLYDNSVEDFDSICQQQWFMPEEYKNLDIVQWVIDQCQNGSELTRAGEELLEFQQRKMIPLLQWLKYLVDTCRANNVVWGVGRGSSVSSFVLFVIGVHKIDPIKYDLDWRDFLR